MQEVITTQEHKYADRQRPVGERYQVEDKFLPAMQHLGWVELYDESKHKAAAAAPEQAAQPRRQARKKSSVAKGRK